MRKGAAPISAKLDGTNQMEYLQIFGAGIVVGALYGLIRVKSPAPPPMALVGLLGIVVGQAAMNTL
ncbi:DUF1427 family protein [Frondihabitans cladoniiphilus]|uniref:XapX domain-containing protein n=1 Tax=Frondihabitans cladoniiphilus TaxID=715785 RepID=A0ABP8W7R8_9MICO